MGFISGGTSGKRGELLLSLLSEFDHQIASPSILFVKFSRGHCPLTNLDEIVLALLGKSSLGASRNFHAG